MQELYLTFYISRYFYFLFYKRAVYIIFPFSKRFKNSETRKQTILYLFELKFLICIYSNTLINMRKNIRQARITAYSVKIVIL